MSNDDLSKQKVLLASNEAIIASLDKRGTVSLHKRIRDEVSFVLGRSKNNTLKKRLEEALDYHGKPTTVLARSYARDAARILLRSAYDRESELVNFSVDKITLGIRRSFVGTELSNASLQAAYRKLAAKLGMKTWDEFLQQKPQRRHDRP